jgi:Tfp pilus assembly PilM family ATPase
VVDYLTVDEPENGSGPHRVILVAARRTQVDFALELLDRVGLHPLALELPVTALARIHRETCQGADSTGSLVVSPGDTTTSMAFVHHGRTLVTRVIPWGLSSATDVLRNALNVPHREALSLLSLYHHSAEGSAGGTTPEDRVKRVVTGLMTPLLEELSSEVTRVWTYAHAEFRNHPPGDISLAGGAAMIPAIAPFLAGRLDRPVSLLDPTRRYRWWELKPGVENGISPVYFAVAAGLAMRTEPCPATN